MKLNRFNTHQISESIDEKKLMPSEFLHPMVKKIKAAMSKSTDNAKWAEETAAALNKIRPKSASVAQDGEQKVVHYIHPEQMSVVMVIRQEEVDFFRRLSITKQVDKDVPQSTKNHKPIDVLKFADVKENELSDVEFLESVDESLITFSKAKEWVKKFIAFLDKAWQEDAEIEIVEVLAKNKGEFEKAPVAAFDYLQRWNDANKEVLDRILGVRTSDRFTDEYDSLLQGKVTESSVSMKNLKTFDQLSEAKDQYEDIEWSDLTNIPWGKKELAAIIKDMDDRWIPIKQLSKQSMMGHAVDNLINKFDIKNVTASSNGPFKEGGYGFFGVDGDEGNGPVKIYAVMTPNRGEVEILGRVSNNK